VTALAELVEEVARSPRGRRVGAFFDYDGTLISGYSGSALFRERLRRRDVSVGEIGRSMVAIMDMNLRGSDVSQLFDIMARGLRGRLEDEAHELGARLFAKQVAGWVFPEARELVRAHQRRGHTIAVASSASLYQVAPFASDAGIDHVLCTLLEVEEGVFTGKLGGPVLWGPGKATAVREFTAAQGIDLSRSYAYANGDEDIPFLETVGNPRPLNPMGELARTARERGWPVSRFASRGRPGLRTLARTGAAFAGFGAASGAGVGLGLLNRSRRDAANLGGVLGAEVGLTVAGIRVDVRGEEHLWSHRPAVFLFNHQSSLDMLVLSKLLRRDFTGVAKKELSRDPRFALIGWLADIAYVDRSNPQQARKALKPAVEKLRNGTSVVIAPEGTRAPTPRLLPFKKGGFHLAMQAGVPIVPIVIRNAGDLAWRNSMILRPGTIQVAVLPPVSVENWTVEQLDERVADVRRRYQDTLDHWPGERRPPRRRASRSARARAPAKA
jgi:putative phosphoserine phosphatase / 1-acylglycerol-3-phosphate O-acyltransferase